MILLEICRAIAIVVILYLHTYKNAKGRGTVYEWRKKVVTGHLWAVSAMLLVFAASILAAPKDLSSEMSALKWEAVLLGFTGIMMCPLTVKGLWRINKSLAVALPILCSVLTVFFIPYSTGLSAGDTIQLIFVGAVNIFAFGAIAVAGIIGALILLLILVGLLSVPIVISI